MLNGELNASLRNINFNEMLNSLLIEFLCCSSSRQLIEFNKTGTTSLWLNLLPITLFGAQSARLCLLLTGLPNQSNVAAPVLIRSRFIDSEINCEYHNKLWDFQWEVDEGERTKPSVGGQLYNGPRFDVFCQ